MNNIERYFVINNIEINHLTINVILKNYDIT